MLANFVVIQLNNNPLFRLLNTIIIAQIEMVAPLKTSNHTNIIL